MKVLSSGMMYSLAVAKTVTSMCGSLMIYLACDVLYMVVQFETSVRGLEPVIRAPMPIMAIYIIG